MAVCEDCRLSLCDDTGGYFIVIKKSCNHCKTWGELTYLRRKAGEKYHMGPTVVDPTTGRVLLMYGGGHLQSADNGDAWQDWNPAFHDREGANRGSTHGSSPGIVKQFGGHRGRIVWPARTIVSEDGYNDMSIPDRQRKWFSMVLYSDDHGRTIHSSNYFLQGTGEGCLTERLDGDLYFNARAYFGDGKRRTAIGRNGGSQFSETPHAVDLREIVQGCNASMVRYPPESCGGRDILLFANPDSTGRLREHGVVQVSFDGGGNGH